MTDDDGTDRDLPDPEDVIAGYDPEDEEEIGDDLPDPSEIIQIHQRIEDEYNLKHTGASVAAPRLRFANLLEEVDEYEGTHMRAAALLRKIITAHYFEDANKRTGWATTRKYLENHREAPADRERVERVLRNIRSFSVEEIAEWLNSGEIDEERFHPR
jgi:prophage maintenance system killer protein